MFRPERDRETMMKLTVNGSAMEYTGKTTLNALIGQLQMNAERVAVELNLSIVPKKDWDTTELHDGDKLEIVHFVGGGKH